MVHGSAASVHADYIEDVALEGPEDPAGGRDELRDVDELVKLTADVVAVRSVMVRDINGQRISTRITRPGSAYVTFFFPLRFRVRVVT